MMGLVVENSKKMYICFKVLKDGFLASFRPLIGVDGCHLKGPQCGIMLTAVGVDPNNNLYAIAYVVVMQWVVDAKAGVTDQATNQPNAAKKKMTVKRKKTQPQQATGGSVAEAENGGSVIEAELELVAEAELEHISNYYQDYQD